MKKRRFLTLVTAGLTGSVLLPRAGLFADEPAPIRVGTLISDTAAEPLYAQDMGFFTQAGLRVELSFFPAYGSLQTALAGRSLDIGVLDALAVGVAQSRGIPFTMIASACQQSSKAPTMIMVVAKNSALKTPRDLENKTVALPTLRTATEASVRAWFAKEGIDGNKVRLIELAFSEMGAALERGTVDAATIAEPSLTAARLAGARPFGKIYDAVALQFYQNVFATTTDYVQANPDLIKRFVGAVYKTANWANAHHNETAAILTKYSKIDPATAHAMTRTEYGTSLDPKLVQPLLDVGHTFGLLPTAVAASTLIAAPFRR